KYNELRMFIGDPAAIDVRVLIRTRRSERDASFKLRPPDWIGTATATQLAVPYLANWGFPAKFERKPSTVKGQVVGIGGSPGVIEGVGRVVLTVDEFDHVRRGDIV